MSRKRKNLRKIPDAILAKAEQISERTVVVASVHADTITAICDRYNHLGLSYEEGVLKFEPSVTPPQHSGRYSKWNLLGRTVVRKDLPKIQKSSSWLAPNFGDWSLGSHTVTRNYLSFPREFLGPKFLQIGIEVLNADQSTDQLMIKFEVLWPLQKDDPSFHENLLTCLNLLQENVGVVDLFAQGASTEELLASIHRVEWEILPPGHKDTVLQRLFGKSPRTPDEIKMYTDRYDLLNSMNPLQWVNGVSGFQRYFGALFNDKLVVLECMRYGNAAYVMFDDWRELSKLSRVELLDSRASEFVRVVHKTGWQDHLTAIVKDRR